MTSAIRRRSRMFWDALTEIAKERGTSKQALVATIKAERRMGGQQRDEFPPL